MSAPLVNAALIMIVSLALALGVRVVARPLVRVGVPPRVDDVRAVPPAASSGQPDSLVATLVDRDPFRVTRRPAPLPYDPVRLAQPAVPRPPLPALALLGIVWDSGRNPTALVDGLPGVDGPRPMRRGQTISGLRLRAITADRVVITGLDTTWTLTVREPWR